ncbi:5-azacytidine resistance protein azr1 [Xylogone sp. PMI_703]|nr:5-azacytidine resistance protein azr1 [Xylogone sp. PMI_703]
MAVPFRVLAPEACKPISLLKDSIRIPRLYTNNDCSRHYHSSIRIPTPTPRRCPRRQARPTPPYHRAFTTSSPSFSSPKFSYGIAASFTAKDRRYDSQKNVFHFNPANAIVAKRKDKRSRPDSGQDSFFVSRVGNTSDIALGIADGVGGWVDSGVDPADFAHGFCDYMAHTAYTYTANGEDGKSVPLSPRALMQTGYERICDDSSVRAGGSTACVAIARGDGTLEVANLGDSGFIQLRLNAIHNYSEPQTHAFNTPYQLSIVPKKIRAQVAAFGGTQLCDFPKDANVSSHQLRHGDVLVFASDGVWDNLSSQDILKIVSRSMTNARAWEYANDGIRVGEFLREFTFVDEPHLPDTYIHTLQSFLAIGITGEAKTASLNTKKDGPFAKEVQRYYPHETYHGGKVDDICVVVVVVVEDGK